MNRSSRVQRLTMPPSSIHHINSCTVDIISPELDQNIISISKKIIQSGEHLRVQAVHKDGHWFALNSAQLDLCRRLESDGTCQVVLVDAVPVTEVPIDVRNMMHVPTKTIHTKNCVSPQTPFSAAARGRNDDNKLGLADKQTAGIDRCLQSDENSLSSASSAASFATATAAAAGVGAGAVCGVGGGGKGYRKLDQMEPKERNQFPQSAVLTMPYENRTAIDTEKRGGGQLQQQGRQQQQQQQPVNCAKERIAGGDEVGEDSSDSECDWSDEGDDSCTGDDDDDDDDDSKRVDTSDEMSCLL